MTRHAAAAAHAVAPPAPDSDTSGAGGPTGGRCPRCDELAPQLPPERRYPVTWHSDSVHDEHGYRTGPFPFTADELRERERLLKLTPDQLYDELAAWRATL